MTPTTTATGRTIAITSRTSPAVVLLRGMIAMSSLLEWFRQIESERLRAQGSFQIFQLFLDVGRVRDGLGDCGPQLVAKCLSQPMDRHFDRALSCAELLRSGSIAA